MDQAIIGDVVQSAKIGAFAEEKDPGIFHPGATLSYKQTQFDVTNVESTFHQGNAKTVVRPEGRRSICVVIEPDIDYYKDLLAHFFLEVVPNKFTRASPTHEPSTSCAGWLANKRGRTSIRFYTMTS